MAAGLAVVINMNYGTGRLSLRGHIGGKKGNDLLVEKIKTQEKEGVRKFCRRDQSPISWF